MGRQDVSFEIWTFCDTKNRGEYEKQRWNKCVVRSGSRTSNIKVMGVSEMDGGRNWAIRRTCDVESGNEGYRRWIIERYKISTAVWNRVNIFLFLYLLFEIFFISVWIKHVSLKKWVSLIVSSYLIVSVIILLTRIFLDIFFYLKILEKVYSKSIFLKKKKKFFIAIGFCWSLLIAFSITFW